MRVRSVIVFLVSGIVLSACGESADKKLVCFDAVEFSGIQQRVAAQGMNMTLACTSKAPWYCDVAVVAKDPGNIGIARGIIAGMVAGIEHCLVGKQFVRKQPTDGNRFFDAPMGSSPFGACGLDVGHKGAGDAGFRFVCV